MAKTLRPRTTNYRRCIAEAPAGSKEKFLLEDLIKQASKKVNRPWIRAIGAGSDQSQFLAHLVPKQGCICGTLVRYEKNKMVPLIDAEGDGSTWEGAVEPKDAGGKKRKLQEQVLFFAVRENHVAVIQTKELSVSDLQDFLCWFIQSKAELADGWIFVLQNLPSKRAVEKLKDHKIKGIKIGKQAFTVTKTPTEETKDSKRKRYTTTVETDPLVMSWLKSVLKNDAIIDELERSTDPGSVHVELDIRYRSRSEKASQQVMQTVAALVGDNPDLDTEIELEGRTKIKGSELTVLGQVSIQCPAGNPSSDDAMTRLAEWLIAQIKTGKVLS